MRKTSPAAVLTGVALCAGPLLLSASAADDPAAAPSPDAVASGGPAYDKDWSVEDVLSGNEPALAGVRARLATGELGRRPQAIQTGGSVDIGDIAVIEDDGTMVVANVTDIFAIVSAFYQTHPDDYDGVVVFVGSNFPGDVDPEAGFAFFARVGSHVDGIGLNGVGEGSEGSGINRLQGLMNMNDLPEYPADPTEDFLGGVASGVEILGQEWEHAYGAFVQTANHDILGRGNAHWSFFLHHPGVGNASPMEGNRWMDNGDGTFTTVEAFTGFAEIDEYLMGLRSPESMQPFWLIEPPEFNDSAFPAENVTVGGSRVDLTIQDVIDNEGARLPDTSLSQKVFRMAFILLVPQGESATQADLDKLNTFRLAWIDYFFNETEGLGSIDTSLTVGPQTLLPFFDDFNGTGPAPDPSNWSFNQNAQISDLGLNEPSGGSSLRLNGAWGSGDEIRSRVIDLSTLGPPAGEVLASYWVQRTGGGDSPEPGDDLLVEYFDASGAWSLLRLIEGDGPDETQFTQFVDALPADALHGAFRLRFHRAQGASGEFDDYFVDDVSIALVVDCPADLDGDGAVGGSDLAILLGEWGAAGGPADLDGDGEVGGADLALLLGLWGACA